MNVVPIAFIFQSSTALIALVIVLFIFWSAVRLDEFRQEMFSLRDELFDYAASGKIKFNDPAYRLLRQLMNGFIRYGHQLTFFRLCIAAIIVRVVEKRQTADWTGKWARALLSVKDDQTRNDLLRFHERTSMLALSRIICGSPILIIVVSLAVLAAICVGLCRSGIKSLRSFARAAQIEAMTRIVNSRLVEEEAARAGSAA